MADAAEKSRAERRYDKSVKPKKDTAPASADKDTPKVKDAPEGEQSAQANGEGAAAAGAPSIANMEDVMARHSREHDEMTKAHTKMMTDMLKRHSEERAAIIGGTGAGGEGA